MEIKDLIGIKYKSNGRDEKGLDCWGIVYLYHLINGIEIPKLDNRYENAENSKEVAPVVEVAKNDFKRIHYELRKTGDIILFNLLGRPVHVGIILDGDKMLHSLAGHNSCVENYNEVVWGSRIEGIYRWES